MKSILKTLSEAQKRARKRIITPSHIDRAKKCLSQRFGDCLKKDLESVKFVVDCNAQTFPSSYRGIPESTLIMLEHKRGEWRVIKIWRGQTMQKEFCLFSGSEILAKALLNANTRF